jgi:hypothetical protein
MRNKWLYFVLAETFMVLTYCLSWVTGFNPVVLVGMIMPNLNAFGCFNVVILSLLTTAIAYSILGWNQFVIWLISLIGIMVISFLIIEPYILLCDSIFNEGVVVELQILIFHACAQILYIVIYTIVNNVFRKR